MAALARGEPINIHAHILVDSPDYYRMMDDKNFHPNTIKILNKDFEQGAIAVKIWKNIGMQLQWPSGKYVMPDDPVIEPIYRDITAHNKTLITHLA